MKSERYKRLEKKRAGMETYLQLKVDEGDNHGIADAAMDLREIQAQLDLLDDLESEAYHDC